MLTIDWLTVFAQVVNFLVLVWLLRRFLYAPLKQAVIRREKQIKERLEEAAEMKRAAVAEAEQLESQRTVMDQQRASLIAAARVEAAKIRHGLEQEARTEVDELRNAWHKDIDEQRDAFMRNVRQSMVQQFFVLGNEALGGLAGHTLETALCAKFVEKLDGLDHDDISKLKRSAVHSGPNVQIASSFEIGEQGRAQIEKTVRERILPDARIAYSTDDRIVFGIEMIVGGQTVSWGLEGYFARLEDRMQAELAEALSGAAETRGSA